MTILEAQQWMDENEVNLTFGYDEKTDTHVCIWNAYYKGLWLKDGFRYRRGQDHGYAFIAAVEQAIGTLELVDAMPESELQSARERQQGPWQNIRWGQLA